MSRPTRSIADTFLAMGAIDALQRDAAQDHAQQWGVPFHVAVVERRFCSKDDVVRAFSLQTGYPVVNLDSEPLDPALTALLPLKIAEQWRAVPLRLDGRRYENIEVAFAPPVEMAAIDAVLAVARKSRVLVHLAADDAVTRAIARLYGLGTVPAPVAEQVQVPLRQVEVQNEHTFDLAAPEASEAARGRPVRLFGWHPAAMRAVKMMLERGGIAADGIDDGELELLDNGEVLISTTLGLRAVLPADARLKMKLIICGTNEQGDPEDARALGAKLFLRPPLSTEQLVAAIHRVRARTRSP
jgi:type IV pilus assembly protein PilB